MCDPLVRFERDETIEIEWGAMAQQVQKDPHGIDQDFADQAMLKVPQIMHSQASDGEALGQTRRLGTSKWRRNSGNEANRMWLETGKLTGLMTTVLMESKAGRSGVVPRVAATARDTAVNDGAERGR